MCLQSMLTIIWVLEEKSLWFKNTTCYLSQNNIEFIVCLWATFVLLFFVLQYALEVLLHLLPFVHFCESVQENFKYRNKNLILNFERKDKLKSHVKS